MKNVLDIGRNIFQTALGGKKQTDKFPKNSEYEPFGGFTGCKTDEMEAPRAFILENCKLTYIGISSFSGLQICQNAFIS